MSFRQDVRLREWDNEWLVHAVLVGFVATVLMSTVLAFAYTIAGVVGSSSPDAPIFARWCWALVNNVVTRQAETAVPVAILLHIAAGIGWAIVYAAFAEPRLSGPGWRRGLVFAPIPALLSLVVFLPAMGGGFLGLGLGAGPLPIIGNVLLHVVYGVTLGTLYHPERDHLLIDRGESESAEEVRTMSHVERTTAIGILVGIIFGAIGGLLVAAAFVPGQPLLVAVMLGVLFGSAAGALFGSAYGFEPRLR
jgi:hypothetical protein